MEFRIQKQPLLAALRLAGAIADRKSTMPILANVLLRVSKRQLTVAATDLAVSLIATLQTVDTKSDGGLTIDARKLLELVGNAPGDEIRLKRTDGNWAEIKAGKASYKIVGLADRDFPKLPAVDEETTFVPLVVDSFRQLINRTLFSTCDDETRHQLNGCYLESDGKTATMVSTDGHRLSVATSKADFSMLPGGIIIPDKALSEIRRLFDAATGAVDIAIRKPHLFVRTADAMLVVKLIDAVYPPYGQVIPKSPTSSATVDRGRLIDALKRVKLVTNDMHGVKLSPSKGALVLAASHSDIGDVTEEIDAEIDGKMPTIGCNPKYLVELLSAMDGDQVQLRFSGELDPVLVQQLSDDSYRGVVMPMRV